LGVFVIRSLLFKLIFYPLLGLWLVGLMILILREDRAHIFSGFRRLVRIVLWLLKHIVGIELEARGLENLPKEGAYILSSKHSSTLDAIAMFHYIPDFTALAKKELFSYPLLGPVLRKMGLYPIDRHSGTARQETPWIAREVKKQGRPLLVFPEGTRVREGEEKKLRSGAFHIREDASMPVITIASNAGYLWPVHKLGMRPGKAIIEIHPPMPEDMDKEAFMTEFRHRIIVRSEALADEVRSASGQEGPGNDG